MPLLADDADLVALPAHDAGLGETSLAMMKSAPLRCKLGPRIVFDIAGFGGKADHQFRPLLVMADGLENVGVFSQFQSGRTAARLFS